MQFISRQFPVAILVESQEGLRRLRDLIGVDDPVVIQIKGRNNRRRWTMMIATFRAMRRTLRFSFGRFFRLCQGECACGHQSRGNA
jgi:hypothetical protein